MTLKGTKDPSYFSIVLDSDSTPPLSIRGELAQYSLELSSWKRGEMIKTGTMEIMETEMEMKVEMEMEM